MAKNMFSNVIDKMISNFVPQEDTEAKLRHHCTVCEYYYDTEYNVDNSTLVAALLKAENLNSKDYTDESLNVFK